MMISLVRLPVFFVLVLSFIFSPGRVFAAPLELMPETAAPAAAVSPEERAVTSTQSLDLSAGTSVAFLAGMEKALSPAIIKTGQARISLSPHAIPEKIPERLLKIRSSKKPGFENLTRTQSNSRYFYEIVKYEDSVFDYETYKVYDGKKNLIKELAKYESVQTYNGGISYALAPPDVSPDGRFLIIGNYENSFRSGVPKQQRLEIYSAETGRYLAQFSLRNPDADPVARINFASSEIVYVTYASGDRTVHDLGPVKISVSLSDAGTWQVSEGGSLEDNSFLQSFTLPAGETASFRTDFSKPFHLKDFSELKASITHNGGPLTVQLRDGEEIIFEQAVQAAPWTSFEIPEALRNRKLTSISFNRGASSQETRAVVYDLSLIRKNRYDHPVVPLYFAEAESAEDVSSYERVYDPQANGGTYLTSLERYAAGASNTSSDFTIKIAVAEAGEYNLVSRLKPPLSTSGLLYQLNGGEYKNLSLTSDGQWNRHVLTEQAVFLEAGIHEIRIMHDVEFSFDYFSFEREGQEKLFKPLSKWEKLLRLAHHAKWEFKTPRRQSKINCILGNCPQRDRLERF